MINLIINTDFKNPYQIYSADGNELILNEIIGNFQRGYLVSILGEEEYAKFEADGDGVPTEAKWTRFLNGYTYDKTTGSRATIPIKYLGIKPVLVKLIYLDFEEYVQDDVTKNGKIRLIHENGKQIKPRKPAVDAWGEALIEIRNGNSYSPTVWNFLNDNSTDYPDWNFTQIEDINEFGI